MIKQLIVISAAYLNLMGWCKADILEKMRVDRPYAIADTVEISNSLEELADREKGIWKFGNFRVLDQNLSQKLSSILDRNSFVEVKVKRMFVKEHACITFRFKDSAKNFSILLVPSYPVRSAAIYRFKESKEGIILESKLSVDFLAMDIYELLGNLIGQNDPLETPR